MADRLYLSLWIRGFEPGNMLRHFEQLLGTFPFSQLRPGAATLSVYAIQEVEPPLVQRAFAGAIGAREIIDAAREFENPDCAYIVETFWDLWQYEGDWNLKPSQAGLICFGPEFDNEVGDHLRIELGVDALYLPDPALPQSGRTAQSNLKSVLRLAADLESSMPVAKRRLWTESGENFADRLDAALSGEEGA